MATADQGRSQCSPAAPAAAHDGLDTGDVATLLSHLANPVRLRILCQLREGEHSVGQMQEFLEISQSALSQHLARLRNAGIVETRRAAKSIIYRLSSEEVRALLDGLCSLYGAETLTGASPLRPRTTGGQTKPRA
ncbi:MAG: metalloregulator ArsR/SmtB family transcription factor [Pseudomonadota bacterium]